MSGREWEPGDVAMRVTNFSRHVAVRVPCCSARTSQVRDVPHWHFASASPRVPAQCGSDHMAEYRPLVVIDPEDREQVERLIDLVAMFETEKRRDYTEPNSGVMQAALREFANPKPPKPEEPTGLGAVVEDSEGKRWVRIGELGFSGADDWKYAGTLPRGSSNDWTTYSDIDAVRVLSEGVQS